MSRDPNLLTPAEMSSTHVAEKVIKSSAFSSGANNKLKWLVISSYSWSFLQAGACVALSGERSVVLKKVMQRDLRLDEASDLLPDDKLTLLCGKGLIRFVVRVVHCVFICDLAEEIRALYEFTKFKDCTLHVAVRHKEQFLLIRGGFVTSGKSHLNFEFGNAWRIRDAAPDLFKEMTDFMYKGKALNLDKMADDLPAAGDKVDKVSLSVMCEDAASAGSSVENAPKTPTVNFISLHPTDPCLVAEALA
uniref:Speckle type BTB/POZ protein n=1 Tax=Fundulus heteroclitus TaxID=8078 RepID=A0A3Q2Q583_FUNHE